MAKARALGLKAPPTAGTQHKLVSAVPCQSRSLSLGSSSVPCKMCTLDLHQVFDSAQDDTMLYVCDPKPKF